MPYTPIGGLSSPPNTSISGVAGTGRKGTINASPAPSSNVAGTSTSWHTVVLWFLGAVVLLAIASPAPTVATWIVVILLVLVLFKNWSVYQSYLGL